eukprot:g2608.t1
MTTIEEKLKARNVVPCGTMKDAQGKEEDEEEEEEIDLDAEKSEEGEADEDPEASANAAIRFMQITPCLAKEALKDGMRTMDKSALSQSWFHPSFTHQIFEDERIAGYLESDKLDIKIYFSMSLAATYVEIESGSGKDKREDHTDLVQRLSPFLPSDPIDDRDTFLKSCAKNFPNPDGTATMQYFRDGKRYEMRTTKLGTGKDEEKSFHERIETFALFFIDGASNIDTDDPRWERLTIWECSDGDGTTPSGLVGYATLFTFTNPTRRENPLAMRICQAFIFPNHQRQGHGKRLMDAAHTIARTRKYFEITVEDPAPGFARLRDVVDLERFLNTARLLAPDCGAVVAITTTARKRRSDAMEETAQDYQYASETYGWVDACKPLAPKALERARREMLTTKAQIVRCFESLILARLDEKFRFVENEDSDAYKSLRLMIKRRLFPTVSAATSEKRKKVLSKLFHEAVGEYRAMWRKLKGERKRKCVRVQEAGELA